MLSAVEPKVEVLMNEPGLRDRVSTLLKQRVSRATLYRWRQDLGVDEDFTPAYAVVLAVFGRCRRQRKSVERSREVALKFAKENDL